MRIDLARVPFTPVFRWLAVTGGIAEQEMLRTFNCGVGMVAVVVAAEKADAAVERFPARGRDRRTAWRSGHPSAATRA